MPHQPTWNRIFAHAIDLAEFEARLTSFFQTQRWGAAVLECGSIVLALDGKTVCGIIPAAQTRGVHLLADHLREVGVVLVQAVVEHKENEIVGATTLLASLPLDGGVVVGDALHAQRALSITIRETNGDFLWFIDQNQPYRT